MYKMGFTKFQKVEDTKVLSSQQNKVVEKELHKLGKTSAKHLTPAERTQLTQKLDK